jgi:hypothetical protein
MREEVVVPFAASAVSAACAVSAVRGTLIASSILSLRAHGYYERYLEGLADPYRDRVLTAIATEWLGVDVAMAHYVACEALGLSAQVQRAIGEEVGDRAQKTFFGFLIRSARTTGVTPWTAFSYVHRARERMFQGGDLSVVKLGPKEARVTCVGLPFTRVPYFRNGFVGVQSAGLRLFTSKVYVRELVELGGDTTFVTAISWV